MSVLNYPALGRSNLSPSFVILMSKVCFAHGGVTIIGNGFDLIAMTDALIGCKYLSLSLGVVFNLYGSAGFLCQKDLHGVVQIYFLSLEYFFFLGHGNLNLNFLFNLFGSAGVQFRKDFQRVVEIYPFILAYPFLLDLIASAGFIFRKDLQRMTEIYYVLSCNILYFRLLTTESFQRRIEERWLGERSKEYDDSMRMLIPQEGEKLWGEKRIGNKVAMIAEIVGFKPRINTGNDTRCMQRYITRVSRNGLDQPSMLRMDQFLPVRAPLLDYLVECTRKVGGWKYPKMEDLRFYQENRGLNLEMLKQIEVRELVCGVSSTEEILDVTQWIKKMYRLDQEKFGTQIISFDVEDVKATFYDTLRMAGKIQIPGERAPLRTKVESEMIYGYLKDEWKQIPGKIMFGNGITWTCLISLDLEQDEMYNYVVKKMEIQSEILELLRDLPVSAGLGIRRDLLGVEEFYSLISGQDVCLESGFVDLTTLAILAGYKFHSRNMTAMGVQVIGTLLNKNVSTGDNSWGMRWSEIPKCLQCYALGDIKFGFITYNVLAGMLLRDVFPDPDVICRFLKCDQITAVNWVLEFVVLSLEAVEFHQGSEELAETREDMIRSLRKRDGRGKLCESSPPFINLWLEILGSWPSVTSGGCRFLFQCREWFLVQIRVLARARIRWSQERVLKFPTAADLEYSRFGLSLDQLGEQTWSQPIPGIWGMVRPEGVKIRTLEFDVSSTKPCEIGRRCTLLGRSQRWSLLEWALLNPSRMKSFFARMCRDVGFQVHYANLYDAMRLSYKRLVDEDAPKVAKVEEILNKGVLSSFRVEKSGVERTESELGIRKQRMDRLNRLTQDWTFDERTRWTDDVPVLPSWRPRGGKKRARSSSRSRVAANRKKPRQIPGASGGAFGEETSVQSSSQPAPGLPGVRNGLVDQDDVPHQGEEREDVVLLDEDDLVDDQSFLVQGSGNLSDSSPMLGFGIKRKSSARKISKKNQVLSYDELIEGPGRVEIDDDDLDFEFEIPKEVEEFEI